MVANQNIMDEKDNNIKELNQIIQNNKNDIQNCLNIIKEKDSAIENVLKD